MKLCIGALVLVAVIVGIHLQFFYAWTTNEVESTSADGMYRCRVVEKTDNAESIAYIYLDRRDGDQWQEFSHRQDSNDSVTRSYSVDWRYDQGNAVERVTVFGISGGTPDAIFTWHVPEQATP